MQIKKFTKMGSLFLLLILTSFLLMSCAVQKTGISYNANELVAQSVQPKGTSTYKAGGTNIAWQYETDTNYVLKVDDATYKVKIQAENLMMTYPNQKVLSARADSFGNINLMQVEPGYAIVPADYELLNVAFGLSRNAVQKASRSASFWGVLGIILLYLMALGCLIFPRFLYVVVRGHQSGYTKRQTLRIVRIIGLLLLILAVILTI